MRQVTKGLWLLVRMPLYFAVAWLLGFGWYYTQLPRMPETLNGDAIVVLTGDAGRIEAGLEMLANGHGQRMLISGVHPSVRATALYGRGADTEALFNCCIDLGREAENTVGNALEAAAWAAGHDFERLIIITSDYHTPRSMVLLRRAMPQRELIPAPVAHEADLEALATEYNKYLFTLVRVGGGL